jgi:hypothetical protein
MTNGLSCRSLAQSNRAQNSLADDSTAVTPPSITSKQPTDYQVITESCEWCMVTTPWNGDDDEEPDPMKVVGTPKLIVDPPRFGRVSSTMNPNALDNNANLKTLGPKMI